MKHVVPDTLVPYKGQQANKITYQSNFPRIGHANNRNSEETIQRTCISGTIRARVKTTVI